jgi:hypothetical protein
MIVNITHARRLKYCSRGIRAFCRRYDIDFLQFVREGLDAEVFIATNDAQALRMVDVARRQEGEE